MLKCLAAQVYAHVYVHVRYMETLVPRDPERFSAELKGLYLAA